VSAAAPIRSIVILGGGVAGWTAAAAFATRLPHVSVTVVETPGTPPRLADLVGTALPSVVEFHGDIRLREAAVLRAGATFRLGTRLLDWSRAAPAFIHGYGEVGGTMGGAAFHHSWLRAGREAGDFDRYSIAAAMIREGRLGVPEGAGAKELPAFLYGFQLDPARYATLLRAHAQAAGARARPGPAAPVIDGESGRIAALRLPDGDTLAADLHVDADGALIEAVAPAWRDWSHWLPGDRLAAVTPAPSRALLADSARARADGWTLDPPAPHSGPGWRLAVGGEGHALRQGRRAAPWAGNVVAIGEAALALEPLAAAPLHIVQTQVDRIVASLPDTRFAAVEIADHNRQAADEADRLRDFTILHYRVADRDEPFWRDLAATAPPEALAYDLALFADRGKLRLHDGESFERDSWFAILLGSGLRPRRIDAVAALAPPGAVTATLAGLRAAIDRAVAAMPLYRPMLEQAA
jgi:tryptophan halogenase